MAKDYNRDGKNSIPVNKSVKAEWKDMIIVCNHGPIFL